MGSWVTRSALGTAIVLACMVGHPGDSRAQHHPPAKPSKEAANPNRGRATDHKQAELSFDKLIKITRTRVQPVARGPQTPQLVCATVHRGQAVFG